jgi:hypothetical protein
MAWIARLLIVMENESTIVIPRYCQSKQKKALTDIGPLLSVRPANENSGKPFTSHRILVDPPRVLLLLEYGFWMCWKVGAAAERGKKTRETRREGGGMGGRGHTTNPWCLYLSYSCAHATPPKLARFATKSVDGPHGCLER